VSFVVVRRWPASIPVNSGDAGYQFRMRQPFLERAGTAIGGGKETALPWIRRTTAHQAVPKIMAYTLFLFDKQNCLAQRGSIELQL